MQDNDLGSLRFLRLPCIVFPNLASSTRVTRGLVCKVHKENAHEHTGSAEAIRPSLRNGFTAYFVLSPVTGFVATVARSSLLLRT